MKSKLLGPLETRAMNYFWNKSQPSTISDLHGYLSSSDPAAYTTISTIVSRLVDKKLLHRKKLGHSYTYQAISSKKEFLKNRSRGFIKNLLGDFGEIAIASFVEEVKLDPVALKKLRELAHE